MKEAPPDLPGGERRKNLRYSELDKENLKQIII
jgi:hypothetical protein